MNEKKICPLLSISSGDDVVSCLGEKCAWYMSPQRPRDEGRCAVQYLGALPMLR